MSGTRNIEDIYELSPLQDALLTQALRSGADTLCPQWVYAFRAPNTAPLRQAWERVIARHTMLRTSFHAEGLSKPVQVVHRRAPLSLEEQDWRTLPPPERRARLETFLQEDRARGFALTQAPLMRLTALRVAQNAYRLVWTYHPLLLDSWSRSLVFREVSACYRGIRQGRNVPLPPVQPYRAYIGWLQQQDRARAQDFWRQNLRGFAAPTPVIQDRDGRNQAQAAQTRAEQLRLTPTLTAALQGLAKQQQLAVAAIVQGAWALLLARHSGQDDVVFGTTVSGRPPALAGVESMVGLFGNTVPVRVRVPGGEPLLPWLRQFQGQLAELRRHDYLPLEQLREYAEVPREWPLFESLTSFPGGPPPRPAGQRKQGPALKLLRGAAQPLSCPLVLARGRRGLSLRISFAADRVEAATVRQLLQQLRAVLLAVVTRPEQELARVSLRRQDYRAPQADADNPGLEMLLGLCLSVLHEQGGTPRESILVPLQPLGSRPPFFCVYAAGGTARSYEPLARDLGQDQPFYGLQPPLALGEPPPRLEDMAAQCLEAMRSVQPQGPYFLGGWSTGGVVAFALAQELRRQGQAVGLLALLDAGVPSKKPAGVEVEKLIIRLARQLRLGISLGLFLQSTPDEQRQYVLQRSRETRLFAADLGIDHFCRQARLFKTYVRAVQAYTPPPYPERIVLFRKAAARAKGKEDPRLGWDKVAALVEWHEVPGTHDTMIREPHVGTLAERLRACLRAAQGAGGGSAPAESL